MGCGASAGDKKAGGGDKLKKASSVVPQKDVVKEGGINHAALVVDNKGKLTDFYDVGKKKIGEGSYGSVSKATNKSTGLVRAVKSIAKAQMKDKNENEKFRNEIAIMKMMDHPNIIKLYENFEDKRCVYLVMEMCSGGELFDRIIEVGTFVEKDAALIMQQVFRAMFYMHELHICHRDLKPENFLFQNKEHIQKSSLKLIDFGLSCKFDANTVLQTKAGTPYYVAPQVLLGKYDQASDLWSCGVIMYVLLCGYPPFYGDTDAEVLNKVKAGKFTFNATDWSNVSEDAKELIRQLLKMDPKERYTSQKALNHIWVKEKAPKAKSEPLQASLVENLRGFRSTNKLKKAALHIIAGNLDESQIKNLKDIFMTLDDNGDGLLTSKELRDGLQKAGLTEIPPDLQQIMEDVDADGSGVIDYTEFLAATLDKKSYIQEDVCWSAFRVFDRNGDGTISKKELDEVLSNGDVASAMGAAAVAELMKEVDTNGDGEIDFNEFMAMMRGTGPKVGDAMKAGAAADAAAATAADTAAEPADLS